MAREHQILFSDLSATGSDTSMSLTKSVLIMIDQNEAHAA